MFGFLLRPSSCFLLLFHRRNFSACSNKMKNVSVYTNGNSLDGHHSMSGPGSLGESSSAPESMSPPPDLPELPDLPPLPPMGAPGDTSMAYPPPPHAMAYGAPSYPMHPYGAGIAPYPTDARPAPLGRRSPPPAGARRSAYRGRSPSPSENDSRYAMSDSDARYDPRAARRGYVSDHYSGYDSDRRGGGHRAADYRSDYSEYEHHPSSSRVRRGHHDHSYISEDEYRGSRRRGAGERQSKSSSKKKEGKSSPIHLLL